MPSIEPSSAAAVRRLPLAAVHRAAGATIEVIDGGERVAAFAGADAPSPGPPPAEYAALTEGAALIDRSYVDRLELLGADRARLLGGLVTCEVRELEPGTSRYGFFTSPQGKVLADFRLLALEDRLWLELPAGLGPAIREHVDKYIVADRVEVLPLVDMLPLTIAGPAAGAYLEPLAEGLPEAAGRHAKTALGSDPARRTEVCLDRHELAGTDAFTLWTSASIAKPFWQELAAVPGAVRVGERALETVRIERGIPRFGADFGPDHLPQETGLEERAVSYTKGCYLGQEVVARLHYRGKANRSARRLLFDGAELPQTGAPVLFEGEEIGTLGSTALSPAAGRGVGIAVLHRKGNTPGNRVEVGGGPSFDPVGATVAEI